MVTVTLTGPDYYQAWIIECAEIELATREIRGGGLNHYLRAEKWPDMLAGFGREPEALLKLMTDFTEGRSPNPQFDFHLTYALMKTFEVDPKLPFTWADTSADPDGIDGHESASKERRYVKRLLENIEENKRQPNQALQTTPVTRSEI